MHTHYSSLVFCIFISEIKAGPDTNESGAEGAALCLSEPAGLSCGGGGGGFIRGW